MVFIFAGNPGRVGSLLAILLIRLLYRDAMPNFPLSLMLAKSLFRVITRSPLLFSELNVSLFSVLLCLSDAIDTSDMLTVPVRSSMPVPITFASILPVKHASSHLSDRLSALGIRVSMCANNIRSCLLPLRARSALMSTMALMSSMPMPPVILLGLYEASKPMFL